MIPNKKNAMETNFLFTCLKIKIRSKERNGRISISTVELGEAGFLMLKLVILSVGEIWPLSFN